MCNKSYSLLSCCGVLIEEFVLFDPTVQLDDVLCDPALVEESSSIGWISSLERRMYKIVFSSRIKLQHLVVSTPYFINILLASLFVKNA